MSSARFHTTFLLVLLFLFSETVMAQAVSKSSASGENHSADKTDSTAFRLNVRGIVYENESLHPMEGAAVKLFNGNDSLLAGNVTQKNGQYILPGIHPGKYTVKVSFMGYKEQKFSLTLPRKNGNFKVSDVLMREDATVMGETVVEGVMPEMTVVDDTVVYNADAFKLPDGSMIEDLVKKLPGIEVDESGNYTWNGKNISQILVDGERFFSNDRNMVLKNLPAEIVDKVKAYDRKSERARFTGIDDGEEHTVLDFAIKKDRKRGWFGDLGGGYGTSERYQGRTNVNRFIGDQKFAVVGNAGNTQGNGMSDHQSGGLQMNYRNKDLLRMDGGLSGNFNQGRNESSSNSQSFENKKAAYSNRHNKGDNNNRSLNFNYNIDWRPDSMTRVQFRPNFSYSSSGSHSSNQSASFRSDPYAIDGITDPLKQILQLADSIGVNSRINASQNSSNNLNGNASLSMNRKFKKRGRNISLEMNGGFGRNKSDGENYSQTDYYQILASDGGDSIYHKVQYNDSKSKNFNLGARASYNEPLTEYINLQLEYGYNYRFTDNDRNVSSIFDPRNAQLGVNWNNYPDYKIYSLPDTAQCNYTTNKYQNHEARAQLSLNRAQYRLSIGATVHPQQNEVDYTKGYKHYDVSRSVVNASPSVNFLYRFSRQHTLRFNYRGNTGQPGITDLIPDTLSNADPLNIRLGNPELKPSFTQNASVNWNKSIRESQRSYTANAEFRTTQNAVSNRTEYNDLTGGRITKPENINGNWNGNAGFNFNTALRNKHFKINTNTRTDLTNSVSYVYQSKTKETVKNRTRSLGATQSVRFSYRNDWLELSARGNIRYNHNRSTNTSASNLDTYRFGYGMSAEVQLPWNMTLSTDIGESSRRGYTDASMNTNELIWGFKVTQRLLPRRNLMLSLEGFDVLNQREEVNRNISATARTDNRTVNVHSYFLLSATLRFGKFGGRGRGRQGGGFEQPRGEDGPRNPENDGQRGGFDGVGRPAGGGPGGGGPGGRF